MKYILLTFFTIFATSSFAVCKNKLPLSEAQKAINLEAGAGKFKCKDKPDEQCICYDGINWHGAELVDRYVDDYDNPIKEKQEIEECDGEADCQEKLALKTCEEAYYNKEFTEVWCSVITGYEQKIEGKNLVNNQTKIDAYELAQAQKAQAQMAVQLARSLRQCGENLIDQIAARNVSKQLSAAQVIEQMTTYELVDRTLSKGAMESALMEVNKITPDGIIVTQEDKDFVINGINECLNLIGS